MSGGMLPFIICAFQVGSEPSIPTRVGSQIGPEFFFDPAESRTSSVDKVSHWLHNEADGGGDIAELRPRAFAGSQSVTLRHHLSSDNLLLDLPQIGHLQTSEQRLMREDGGSSPSRNSNMQFSDPLMRPSADDEEFLRHSSSSTTASSSGEYPMAMSGESSPFVMSPWHQSALDNHLDLAGATPRNGLITSLFREEGHIYSLAAVGDVLYTGSDSKNIRVWKNQKDFAGFKSSSGLVKSIVVAADRIFTGHQDGKIRVWRVSPKNPTVHKRIGNLPRLKDVLRSSLKPSNYIEVRRHRSALWIRHSDAISCLSLDENQGLLYSGSWDKTFKVWRIADSRCLESVIAHDDAVNSVVAAFGGLVFTGSADGTVKVWRRELLAKTTKHSPVRTLLKQECAVTALAVSPAAPLVYCGSSDGFVNFWEGESQLAHGGVLGGHKMAVLCLVAAGNLLLSGSADKNICVWRRDGGVHCCLSVLSGHTGPVKCLAIVADGEEEDVGGAVRSWIAYSGSLDKSVKVWRVSEQPPDALLRAPMNVPADP